MENYQVINLQKISAIIQNKTKHKKEKEENNKK
jgi:hypothetical protein